MTEEKIVLSVEEVARLLGISRFLAYECARRGTIPTIRLGRRLLIPREAFMAWLRGQNAEEDSR